MPAGTVASRGTRRTGRCLASRAELQADGPAPSWFVRVRACLAFHFAGARPRECRDCPGLFIGEPGRRLFAIVPGPAAKPTHSAAKKTHSGILGRRLADLSHPRLRARSAGRSKCVLCRSEAAAPSQPSPRSAARSSPGPPSNRWNPAARGRAVVSIQLPTTKASSTAHDLP